jgi:glycosyltransferase involved in cell wall biosynthesis
MIPVTFVILAKNEIKDLPFCLDSLVGVSDDIHLLDSGSTDGTFNYAISRGIHVHQNQFTGFGDQRNWAIDNIVSKYDWQFHLDADERFTLALKTEIEKLIGSMPTHAGFFVPNRLILNGKWLKHSSGYPIYQVRLFHRNRLRFCNQGHGQREVTSGTLGRILQPYDHHAFSKGVENWLTKHILYAIAEARHTEEKESINIRAFCRDVFHDAITRRRLLKRFRSYVPCRPTVRYLHQLFIKRGILDGKEGIKYAKMLSVYEAMQDIFLGFTEEEKLSG